MFNTDFIEHPSSSSMMELIVQDPADTRQQLHRVTLPLSGCHTHILLSAIFSVSGSFFTLELVQCDPKAISKLTAAHKEAVLHDSPLLWRKECVSKVFGVMQV